MPLDNGVSLDFMEIAGPIASQHYAFLIEESQFDAIVSRIRAERLSYWADPMRSRPNEINHHDEGHGVYFEDLDGHLLEVITRPYGSGGSGDARRHHARKVEAANNEGGQG